MSAKTQEMFMRSKSRGIGKIPDGIMLSLAGATILVAFVTAVNTSHIELVFGRMLVHLASVIGISALIYWGWNMLVSEEYEVSWRGLPQLGVATWIVWSMLRTLWAMLPFGNSDTFVGATYKVLVQVGNGGDIVAAAVITAVIMIAVMTAAEEDDEYVDCSCCHGMSALR